MLYVYKQWKFEQQKETNSYLVPTLHARHLKKSSELLRQSPPFYVKENWALEKLSNLFKFA